VICLEPARLCTGAISPGARAAQAFASYGVHTRTRRRVKRHANDMLRRLRRAHTCHVRAHLFDCLGSDEQEGAEAARLFPPALPSALFPTPLALQECYLETECCFRTTSHPVHNPEPYCQTATAARKRLRLRASVKASASRCHTARQAPNQCIQAP